MSVTKTRNRLYVPRLSVGVAVLLLAACPRPQGSVQSSLGKAAVDVRADTALGAGDVFDVRVYGEPELSGTYRVQSDGTIDYPLIGKVVVGGKPPSEAANMIAEKLREGFLRNPQVSLLVKEYNSKKVIVIGQVKSPGTFPYVEEMTVIQAITMAGGFSDLAAKNDIVVTRVSNGQETRIKVQAGAVAEGRAPNLALRPGDRVWVPERLF
jgi:polysaccharide export outer membrane protein